MTESDPRRLLAAFVRAHREQLSAPANSAGRRRTPGWRREEVAGAAAVSVTWLTWLEQGREIAVSPAALSRLANVLRLSAAERASLFDLAGKRDPELLAEPQADLLPDLLDLPAQFAGPAYLLDACWTARAWNPAAAELFAGWLDADSGERNLLRFVFLNPKARQLLADWPERAARLAAEFRADFSRQPRHAAMQALIDNLGNDSADFERLWRDQAVLSREGGERRFVHPVHGAMRYKQTTLLAALQPDCKLVCLLPVRS
ncbi:MULTISPECIES: helix-turn-helix transcriptional regulator [Methylomonas]|uniref:helix-turn-helix transcriptional regulator n=1 Tax=Methylomonas TaxID=416 RepID=UPI0012319094|nr:helix-turn-helix transcriptional regulator [Methylomonas rhizoryzae]